ncbi:MAG: hypothetical protein QOD71_1757 [Thermoleophilaceae bacterium]|jgi:hypothetical protein|nr:hypothetical protein [Thermoleophilaceae bacterium]
MLSPEAAPRLGLCPNLVATLVAQLYLRGFARERKRGEWQAVVVGRRTSERHLSNVRDIFKERDWNTVVDEEGNRDYAVEELLAERIDGPAAPVFEPRMSSRWPLRRAEQWLGSSLLS